jgi:hypothetical protein
MSSGGRLRSLGISIMKSVRRRPALSRVGATCHSGNPGADPDLVVSVEEA